MEGASESRRRVTLWERMSAVENNRGSLAGLTLDAVLSGTKTVPPTDTAVSPAPATGAGGRTLLDVIRDEPPHKGQKDKKSWKTFRERLRLKRTGSAWTSSVHTPTSDIIQPRPAYPRSRGPHVRFVTPESARENSTSAAQSNTTGDENHEIDTVPVSDPPQQQQRPMFARRSSTRVGSFQPDNNDSADDHDSPGPRRLGSALAEERALSAREAAAAQEAAEAEAEDDSDDDDGSGGGGGGGQMMSLMDLLEETDRQMGLSGSRYTMGEEDEEEEEEDEEEDDDVAVEEDEDGGGVEHTCCVCMVRHKGAAFIPCGHTFCRLCSRELLVQRGQCPLCNGFILEILDIF